MKKVVEQIWDASKCTRKVDKVEFLIGAGLILLFIILFPLFMSIAFGGDYAVFRSDYVGSNHYRVVELYDWFPNSTIRCVQLNVYGLSCWRWKNEVFVRVGL